MAVRRGKADVCKISVEIDHPGVELPKCHCSYRAGYPHRSSIQFCSLTTSFGNEYIYSINKSAPAPEAPEMGAPRRASEREV